MLHSIKKLIGDKGRQLIVPIVLMSRKSCDVSDAVLYCGSSFKRNAFRYTCTELYHCMLDKRNTSADHI